MKPGLSSFGRSVPSHLPSFSGVWAFCPSTLCHFLSPTLSKSPYSQSAVTSLVQWSSSLLWFKLINLIHIILNSPSLPSPHHHIFQNSEEPHYMFLPPSISADPLASRLRRGLSPSFILYQKDASPNNCWKFNFCTSIDFSYIFSMNVSSLTYMVNLYCKKTKLVILNVKVTKLTTHWKRWAAEILLPLLFQLS